MVEGDGLRVAPVLVAMSAEIPTGALALNRACLVDNVGNVVPLE